MQNTLRSTVGGAADAASDARSADAARLCAVLGHELRNPLAAALTSVAVAAEMTDADDPRRAFLQRAGRDMERVSALLEGWLALARGRGRAGDRFDPGAALRDVTDRLGVAFDVRIARDASVVGHRALLERAVENLVVNARAAGATTVQVTARCADGGGRALVVDVDDDGPGVPEHLRAGNRLFEDLVTDSGPSGTGLGLGIVRDVVASFGGSVAALERGGGRRGARFRIVLPLHGEEVARSRGLAELLAEVGA